MIQSINPATEALLEQFDPLDASAVEKRLSAADDAYRRWRTEPSAARARIVHRAGDLLEAERETYARLLTEEMGKTIRAARDEVTKCVLTLRFYADRAAELLADTAIADGGLVTYQPLGPVLAIMPWNFPFWQVVRFAAPALTAGNVALLKHASNVPRCALALEELFTRAGAPRGVFQTLLVETGAVASLIADPRVAAVTLTGSEGAGRAVAETAGAHLKKCVLELGGSDPFVVLADADIAAAAQTAVASRTVNNGQSCIAAKRFIVERGAYDEFLAEFVAGMQSLRVGDPLADDTDLGPLATAQIRAEVASQVERTVAAGAHIETGGSAPAGSGFFYEPTILTNVPPHSPAAVEEVFGPVAAVFAADSANAALEMANSTRFGLGANVWTRNEVLADRFARELEAGTVFINGMVASDPRFPFGGVKASGYGRELGVEGMREFMNIKTIRRGGPAVSGQPQAE